MKNTTSNFPSSIDDRIFFSDVSLDNKNIYVEYNELISNHKYTQASQLLNDSDVDFYGAWLLNLLENRLHAIQNYVQSQEKNIVVSYNKKPTKNNMHWIDSRY